LLLASTLVLSQVQAAVSAGLTPFCCQPYVVVAHLLHCLFSNHAAAIEGMLTSVVTHCSSKQLPFERPFADSQAAFWGTFTA